MNSDRQPNFLQKHWPTLVLLLLPIIPLWRAILLGEAIGPFDQILQMSPWKQAPNPGRVWDVLHADSVLQFYAWRDLVFDAWGKMQPPLWNPYQLMGTPLMANSQSAAFYPLHILMGVLHVPTAMAITLLGWFHLAWASLGVAKLVRQWGGGVEGSVFAGAVISLSPFMLGWLPLASVVTTVAWIPWCFVFLDQLFGEKPIKAAGLLGACVGMMILGGHLQFVFYGFIGLLLAGLALLVMRWKSSGSNAWKAPVFAVLAIGMGVGLAAPQLLPVLQYSKFSHRQGIATSEGYNAYVAGGLAPFELLGVSFPSLMGYPGKPVSDEQELAGIGSYWPAFVRRGASFAEGALGVGPVLFGLLMMIRRKHRASQGLIVSAAVGVVSLLMAFGTPLNMLFYFGIPGFSATGSPGRSICLFVIAAAVAAGLLWPTEDEEWPEKKKWIGATAGVLLVSIAAASMMRGLPSWIPQFDASVVISKSLAFGMALAIAAGILAIGLVFIPKEHRRLGTLACAALSQVLLAAFFVVPTSAHVFEKTATQEPNTRNAFVNADWQLMAAAPALYPPNTASSVRLYDVGGYDSLLHRDTVKAIHDADGEDPAPQANGNIMLIKPRFDLEALKNLGVSVVYSTRELPQFTGQTPEEKDGVLKYTTDGPGRVSIEGGTAKIVEDGANSCTVEVDSSGGTLVLRDRNMPGWKAEVDGKSVEIKGELFREVEVPSGKHTVKYLYDPPGLSTGTQICLVSLVLITVCIAITTLLARKNTK